MSMTYNRLIRDNELVTLDQARKRLKFKEVCTILYGNGDDIVCMVRHDRCPLKLHGKLQEKCFNFHKCKLKRKRENK